MVSARKRPLPARIAVSALQWLAVLALTFAVGEGIARFVFGVRPLTTAALLWTYHPRWGWYHQPNADDVFVKLGFEQPIHINSHGLREREIPYEKSPGVYRILMLGDSVVASFEVPPEAAFTRVAERILRERGYPVEIVNAGVRGYGTDQELLFLEDEGIRYKPDLVLYLWIGNDPSDNSTVHRPFRVFGKPYFDLDENGSLVLRGVPVPDYPYTSNLRVGEDGKVHELTVDLRSRIVLWLRDVLICRSAFATALTKIAMSLPQVGSLASVGAYEDERDHPRADSESRLFRVTAEMVREMRRVSERSGAQFRMVAGGGDFGLEVERAIGQPETGVHRSFKDRIPEGASVHVPYDPHWNELGERLFGEALAEWLAGSGLLGPPQPAAPGTPTESG
jgi:hypothetical protein